MFVPLEQKEIITQPEHGGEMEEIVLPTDSEMEILNNNNLEYKLKSLDDKHSQLALRQQYMESLVTFEHKYHVMAGNVQF